VVIQSGYFYYRGCNPRATGLMQSRHNKYQAMLVAFPPDFSVLLIFSAPRAASGSRVARGVAGRNISGVPGRADCFSLRFLCLAPPPFALPGACEREKWADERDKWTASRGWQCDREVVL
jgi:hypothetical protein